MAQFLSAIAGEHSTQRAADIGNCNVNTGAGASNQAEIRFNSALAPTAIVVPSHRRREKSACSIF
jgi:hypothetical protein